MQFISTFFRWKKKITAFLQTPIKDEGEGVPSWEKKIDIKLWSVEDVLIVGGRWEGLHFMEKNREVDRFFFRHNVSDLIIIPGKGLKKIQNLIKIFVQKPCSRVVDIKCESSKVSRRRKVIKLKLPFFTFWLT